MSASEDEDLPAVNSPVFMNQGQQQHIAMQNQPSPPPTAYYHGYGPAPWPFQPGPAPPMPHGMHPYGLAVPNPMYPVAPNGPPPRVTLGTIAVPNPRPVSDKRSRTDSTSTSSEPAAKHSQRKGGQSAPSSNGLHWTADEKSKLFSFFLDPSHEDNFKLLSKYKTTAMQKASDLFVNRSKDSVSGLWERSLRTYRATIALMEFTGGAGDGDQDPDQPEDEKPKYERRIIGAKAAGKAVGKLSADDVILWEKKGWFKLFDDRYGSRSNFKRVFAHSSGGDMSDPEDIQTQNSDDVSNNGTQAADIDLSQSVNSQDNSQEQVDPNLSQESVPFSDWEPSQPTFLQNETRHPSPEDKIQEEPGYLMAV
ncbi:hypothetical protein C8J56DRAFT_1113655 [Mycena floridula]|nr:hypothetical protein C8J56DRAFT_1113655 [Mycena floridula]